MRKKLLYLRGFLWIGLIKSIYINFRLLPFRQAIKLPIIVSKSTHLDSLSGEIVLEVKVKFAMLRIGFFQTDFMSWKENINFIKIDGKWHINGQTNLGVGCKIVIDKDAKLFIGDNFVLGSNSKIICRDKIEIQSNCRIAWDVQIMDTNFHYIKDIENGRVQKKTNPIFIGLNNWIGNRSSIMPGTQTPDYFIIASNSLCNKNYKKDFYSFTMIGGTPAKLIKTNVCRVLDKEEFEIDKLFLETNVSELFVNNEPRARH